MASNAIIAELKRIAATRGGVLYPSVVVDEARPVTSVLHSKFEWDDTKAAEEYRLEQARKLIRVTVEMVTPENPYQTMRVFVSLKQDRVTGGGYVPLRMVLSDDAKRERLLADALDDLDRLREKYSELKELAGVFAELVAIKRRVQRKPPDGVKGKPETPNLDKSV